MNECLHTAEAPECDWLPVLAFLPKQELGEVYEPECGFSRGTIFPVLDKPFLAGGVRAMNPATMTSCGLRRRIAAYDFALVEMNLYLDTHPCDKEALELMYAYRRKREELVETYEQHFGPYEITARDVENPDRWSWVDAPWPWENA